MILRDVLARITRAVETLQDGDRQLAEQLLDDLVAELEHYAAVRPAQLRRVA